MFESMPFLLIILLIVCIVTELDNRNLLRLYVADEPLKKYHSVFYMLVVCLILSAVVAFVSTSDKSKLSDLQDKYDTLQEQYDTLQEKYDSVYYD